MHPITKKKSRSANELKRAKRSKRGKKVQKGPKGAKRGQKMIGFSEASGPDGQLIR